MQGGCVRLCGAGGRYEHARGAGEQLSSPERLLGKLLLRSVGSPTNYYIRYLVPVRIYLVSGTRVVVVLCTTRRLCFSWMGTIVRTTASIYI